MEPILEPRSTPSHSARRETTRGTEIPQSDEVAQAVRLDVDTAAHLLELLVQADHAKVFGDCADHLDIRGDCTVCTSLQELQLAIWEQEQRQAAVTVSAPYAAPLAALLARDMDTAFALLVEMNDGALDQLKALGYRLDNAIPSRPDRRERVQRGLNPVTGKPEERSRG